MYNRGNKKFPHRLIILLYVYYIYITQIKDINNELPKCILALYIGTDSVNMLNSFSCKKYMTKVEINIIF